MRTRTRPDCRSPLLAIGGTLCFLLSAVAAFPDDYGSFYNPSSYYSELDHEKAANKARKESEREASKERMRELSDRRRAEADANRVPYVPKTPEAAKLVVNVKPVNMHDVVDSMLASEGGSAARIQEVAPPPKFAGKTIIMVKDETFYYQDGVFYMLNGDELTETPAPIGALVFKLPQGFEVVESDSGRLYKAKNVLYTRVMVSGKAGFKVKGTVD